MDFAMPSNTPVQSNVSGKVVTAGNDPDGWGLYVRVRDSQGRDHIYAHLNNHNVRTGDTIRAGQVVGKSGSTGMSTGPHLHYEVREGNQSINPSGYLRMRA